MIATLGPEGTYSHRAALKVDEDVRFYSGVPEIADAVVDGDVEAGVVPMENSIEGSVNATLDVLGDYEVYITGEVHVDVRHALLAQDDEFSVVASHPQALAQCRGFLRERYPDAEVKSVSSTAAGVELAREDSDVAAIAHVSLAGDGVQVIAEDVQDEGGNTTRFVRLETEPRDGGSKTSIVVYPGKDRPGLLYDILGVFKERDINLTRLESRPSKHALGDYVFHIDFEGGDSGDVVSELERQVEWVEYLGSYDRLD